MDAQQRVAEQVKQELANRRRRNLRIAAVSGLLLIIPLLVILYLPVLVAKTGFRDRALASAFPNWKGRIESKSASLWWFSPVRFENVVITSADGEKAVSIGRFESQKTLWSLIGADDLGELRLDDADIQIVVLEEGVNLSELVKREGKPDRQRTMSLVLKNASLAVRGTAPDFPETKLSSLNVNASLEYDNAGNRIWKVSSGRLLDKIPVTRDLVETGLKYIAPILANAAWVEGKLSLDLEQCEIPVSNPRESLVTGQLSVHSIEAGAKNPVIIDIMGFAGNVLQREVPTNIRLADESVVDFRLENGRVQHRNLKFGLPDVSPELQIETEGSVGLDRTLDLTAVIPLPLARFADNPLVRGLANHKITLAITGTLKEPQINLVGALTGTSTNTAQELLQQLMQAPAAASKSMDILRDLQQLGDPGKAKAEAGASEPKVEEQLFSIGQELLDQARKQTEKRLKAQKSEESSTDAKDKPEEKKERKRPLQGLLKRLHGQ